MKDLIIYKNVITGKFVYGYKIEVKAEDYPLKIDHGNINLDFILDYVNKDLFNELIMSK